MFDTLTDILPYAASTHGKGVALRIGERTLTFRGLDEEASRLANGLTGLGVGRGDIVTLYSENRWEWIVSYYGVLKLGAVINPINVMLTPAEVKFVVRDCGAKVILASGEKGRPLLGLVETTDIGSIVLFDDIGSLVSVDFASLLAGSDRSFSSPRVQAGDLATICYTSGTTGRPKGAMQSHRAVMWNAAMTAQMQLRTSADVAVNALPLAHVYGTVVMNSTLLVGSTLVVHPRFDAGEILDSIEQHGATTFDGVPTMYMYLLNHAGLDDRNLSTLTKCFVGGQTMPVAKMREAEARLGCPLRELWGMTELAGLGTTVPFYGSPRLGSVGIAMPYADVRIAAVDDASATLPRGEVGELMVRGPFVMLGYYGNAAATKEAIEPDGWMHTGDLASMDRDGYVFVVDRKKDMIITGGFNVYPAEIERVVAAHPSVALVAVGRQPHDTKGEIAKAYVVLKEGCEPDAEGIFAHCRQELAAYKVPRSITFVAALPMTSTGKVMRRELQTLDA